MIKNVTSVFGQAINFLKEVRSELSKVEWPSTQEFIGSTIVTLILVLIFMVFVFLIDWFANLAIQYIL